MLDPNLGWAAGAGFLLLVWAMYVRLFQKRDGPAPCCRSWTGAFAGKATIGAQGCQLGRTLVV